MGEGGQGGTTHSAGLQNTHASSKFSDLHLPSPSASRSPPSRAAQPNALPPARPFTLGSSHPVCVVLSRVCSVHSHPALHTPRGRRRGSSRLCVAWGSAGRGMPPPPLPSQQPRSSQQPQSSEQPQPSQPPHSSHQPVSSQQPLVAGLALGRPQLRRPKRRREKDSAIPWHGRGYK